jgi:hypothetical protein
VGDPVGRLAICGHQLERVGIGGRDGDPNPVARAERLALDQGNPLVRIGRFGGQNGGA